MSATAVDRINAATRDVETEHGRALDALAGKLGAAELLRVALWALDQGGMSAADQAAVLDLIERKESASCPECDDATSGALCDEHVAARADDLTGCPECGHHDGGWCHTCRDDDQEAA